MKGTLRRITAIIALVTITLAAMSQRSADMVSRQGL